MNRAQRRAAARKIVKGREPRRVAADALKSDPGRPSWRVRLSLWWVDVRVRYLERLVARKKRRG